MGIYITILVLVALVTIVLWMLAIGDLMSRPDSDFPGPFDKLSWAIILTFTGLFGIIAYSISGPSRTSVPDLTSSSGESKREGHIHRADDECLRCGARVPAESDKCPECGWSYADS